MTSTFFPTVTLIYMSRQDWTLYAGAHPIGYGSYNKISKLDSYWNYANRSSTLCLTISD